MSAVAARANMTALGCARRVTLGLTLGLALALALGCSGGAAKPGAGSAPAAVDRDTCMTADDCTLVEACCGCSGGGRRVALRMDAVPVYDATRATRCDETVCAAMMSSHPSCNAEATCEAGHCKVMAHMSSDPP